jgi:hypothetical protein
MPSLDLLEELGFTFGSEGVVALQHYIEEDAEGPHISIDGTVVDFGHDFRCHVGWSSAEGVDSPTLPAAKAKTKIDQLDLLVSIDEDIFCLDIAMDYILIMQIQQSLSNYQYKLLSFGLCQAMLWF